MRPIWEYCDLCQIVWDEKKQRWVDLNEPEEEVCKIENVFSRLDL